MNSYQLSAISYQQSPRTAVRGSLMPSTRRTDAPSPRSAFTLTEILVTIGLIALLIAITVTVYSGTNTAARRSATVATVKKIDELLHARIDGFNRWLATQGDNVPFDVEPPFDDDGPRSLVIGRKRRLREYFPQQFLESNSPISAGPSHDDLTESSECLFFFLTHGEAFGAEPVSDDAFGTGEVADTDGDGLREFIDGWGRPLRFYRWPTRLVRGGEWVDAGYIPPPMATTLLGTIPADTQDPDAIHDPDDTLGLILAGLRSMPPAFSAEAFEQSYHTADTYHAPLVVSAGPDGFLGLYEPNDVPNFGHLAAPLLDPEGDPNLTALEEADDNITNLNQRAGSR
ncbi:MAG: type II secretion system protein [Planctomycetaceae bacterium]